MDDYYEFPNLSIVNNFTTIASGYLYKQSNYPYWFYHSTTNNNRLIGMAAILSGTIHEYIFSRTPGVIYFWNRRTSNTTVEDYRTVNSDFNPIGQLYYHDTKPSTQSGVTYNINIQSTLEECYAIAETYFGIGSLYPINYRLTNCTAPDAPSEASIGSTVTVPFVFPDGYGIVNNENVYVTNNGVIVPSTYSDGVLTFEMPNPD